jgi:hypothetical protein
MIAILPQVIKMSNAGRSIRHRDYKDQQRLFLVQPLFSQTGIFLNDKWISAISHRYQVLTLYHFPNYYHLKSNGPGN